MKENVLADEELLTHVILPAPGNVKSASYEIRYKQSHDWPLAMATVTRSLRSTSNMPCADHGVGGTTSVLPHTN